MLYSQEKKLLEFCEESVPTILNGRMTGDKEKKEIRIQERKEHQSLTVHNKRRRGGEAVGKKDMKN